MAYRHSIQSDHGIAGRSTGQNRFGAFISLPQAEEPYLSDATRTRLSKGNDPRVDFAVDLDVRHTAKDGKRGSGAC